MVLFMSFGMKVIRRDQKARNNGEVSHSAFSGQA